MYLYQLTVIYFKNNKGNKRVWVGPSTWLNPTECKNVGPAVDGATYKEVVCVLHCSLTWQMIWGVPDYHVPIKNKGKGRKKPWIQGQKWSRKVKPWHLQHNLIALFTYQSICWLEISFLHIRFSVFQSALWRSFAQWKISFSSWLMANKVKWLSG